MSVEVKDLSFSYGERPVLKNLRFVLPERALIAVLGPNGAGKTTLFRCLLNLLPRYEGEILFDGTPGKSISRSRMARLAAYVPQSAVPTFSYTVLETVLMGLTGGLSLLERPGRAEQARAMAALARLGMETMAQRSIDTLSGGERQLVLLARALVQEAKLLVMDEPTANLDYGNRHRVLQQMRELTGQGYSVLFSTHDPDQALRYASHVLALQNGELAAFGETDAVLTEELIEKLYQTPVCIVQTETQAGIVRSCVPL